jgi:hypothetical protein
MYASVFQEIFSLRVFWSKFCTDFWFVPCLLPASLIPSHPVPSLMWSSSCLVKSTINEVIVIHFSVSCSLLSRRYRYSPCSQTPPLYVLPLMWNQVSHPYKTTNRITVWYTLISACLGNTLEGKFYDLSGNKHFPEIICSSFLLACRSDYLAVVPVYWNFSAMKMDLLSVFILWLCHILMTWHEHITFSLCLLIGQHSC